MVFWLDSSKTVPLLVITARRKIHEGRQIKRSIPKAGSAVPE